MGKREAEPDDVGLLDPFRDNWRALLGLVVMLVALPTMSLVSLPAALESGGRMRDAAVCASDTGEADCLEQVPAVALEPASCRKGCLHDPWLFGLRSPAPDEQGRNVVASDEVRLPFPEFGSQVRAGEVGQVLFWHRDAVAFRHADGSLEKSLDWGYGYTVEARIFVVLPFLLGFVLVGRWWLLRRRRTILNSPEAVLYLGLVCGCLLGWLGWMLTGVPGLFIGMALPFSAAVAVAAAMIRHRGRGEHERHT